LCPGDGLSSVRGMKDLASRRLVDPRYAWLGFALPADARRFRTDDPDLGAVLAETGAELVTNAPDVEIAPPGGLLGDAATAVVPIQPRNRSGGSRVRRGADRIVRGARLSLGRGQASRALKRHGYANSHTIAWERSIPVAGRGLPKVESRRLAHRLPVNSVVVGHRRDPSPTIFDDVVDAAGRTVRQVFCPMRVVFGSSGVIVADLGDAILRLAVGPATARLHAHRRTVEQLLTLDPPTAVRQRVPRVIAYGHEGLAAWTLEERLPGDHPSRPGLDLTAECAEFLAHLARLPVAGSSRGRLETAAKTIGRECSDAVAEEVVRAAANAMDALADLACCFVHGDFWSGNLLVDGNRLTGVIDWSAGGPDGLPTIDALHLGLSSIREKTSEPLGLAVAAHLLSGDELVASKLVQAYVGRLELELSAGERRALVVAYWLDALSRDLQDPDSVHDGEQARWQRENVAPVLRAIRDGRSRPMVMNGAEQ
jgi:aminoglycoside phosphotransferase